MKLCSQHESSVFSSVTPALGMTSRGLSSWVVRKCCLLIKLELNIDAGIWNFLAGTQLDRSASSCPETQVGRRWRPGGTGTTTVLGHHGNLVLLVFSGRKEVGNAPPSTVHTTALASTETSMSMSTASPCRHPDTPRHSHTCHCPVSAHCSSMNNPNNSTCAFALVDLGQGWDKPARVPLIASGGLIPLRLKLVAHNHSPSLPPSGLSTIHPSATDATATRSTS